MKQDAKNYIKRYFKERGLVYPFHALDAFMFLVSEIGELSDSLVSLTEQWIRNHPDRERNIDEELADVYMMLAITADLCGVDLDEQLLKKMADKGYDYRGEE